MKKKNKDIGYLSVIFSIVIVIIIVLFICPYLFGKAKTNQVTQNTVTKTKDVISTSKDIAVHSEETLYKNPSQVIAKQVQVISNRNTSSNFVNSILGGKEGTKEYYYVRQPHTIRSIRNWYVQFKNIFGW